MFFHILPAKPDCAGNAINVADFGNAGDQSMRRALQEFDLQVAIDAILLQQFAQFMVVRDQ